VSAAVTVDSEPRTPKNGFAVGKARDIHPILYGVAVLFVLYFLARPTR
jgi:xanthine/uracil/vitamin C permease (AzgA family)